MTRISAHDRVRTWSCPAIRWGLLVATLVALRIIVGFHFFGEGADKIRTGTFSAQPFLESAVGPLAPAIRRWLPDPSGEIRLSVRKSDSSESGENFTIDPELTHALWIDFVDRARHYYAWTPGEYSQAEAVLKQYRERLDEWLQENRQDILTHFNTEHRGEGFERDGSRRSLAAQQVASLRDQLARIQAQRRENLMRWTSEIETLWDALELEINFLGANALAARSSPPRAPLTLHRPFVQQGRVLDFLNAVIPWFDLMVGALLIVGLLTPWAALAGALFLFAVMATQPPWVVGAAPTHYQLLECVVLVAVALSGTGRVAGLDFFWCAWRRRTSQPLDVASNRPDASDARGVRTEIRKMP